MRTGTDSNRLADWMSDAEDLTLAAGQYVEEGVKYTALYR